VRRGLPILLACALGLLSACGNSRTAIPSLTQPATGGPLRRFSYPADGVSFLAPRSWSAIGEPAPMVAALGSGSAVVALWRYPRSAAPPRSAAQLSLARRALLAGARARDGGLMVIGSRILRIDGAPAIELDATEQIAGQLRRSRATHVFTDRAEIVLDEYAPVDLFDQIDVRVLSPLQRSLSISSPAA
jgi:hypothetical protein